MPWHLTASCDGCSEEQMAQIGSVEISRDGIRESGWKVIRHPGGFWNDHLLCPDCANEGPPKTTRREFEDIPLFETANPDWKWDGKTPIAEALSNYLESVSEKSGDSA